MRTFDVIVLGGGTSGCVTTNYLANAGLKVCLVEAGPDYGPFSSGRWPQEILDGKVAPVTTHDWGLHHNNKVGKDINDLRAKVIGGCSSHNHCGAVWPPPEDFDSWSTIPNSGWSYKDIFPLIDKIERVAVDSRTPYRGRNGLLPTRLMKDNDVTPSRRYFIRTAEACGYPSLQDMSASLPAEGIGSMHCNVNDDYIRWNSAFAFLDPVRNLSNLTILSNALVDRIVIQGSRAVEVLCRLGDSTALKIGAGTFVLAAGVYGSPTILLRSGIGPRQELQAKGIAENVNLQGVGKNLHDHPNISIRFKPTDFGKKLLDDEIKTKTLATTILRAKSSDSAKSFDLHIIPRIAKTEDNEMIFGTLAENMAPRSRGRVTIEGKDPELPPHVDFQFFSDEGDHDALILRDGLLLARRLWNAEPMRSLIEKEVLPGSDDNELLEYIKQNNMTYHHPVGTCKMGPSSDQNAVVDFSGLVNGTDNVFVADGSIMPIIPRANTNLTCLLIGLKIAMSVIAI